MDPLSIAAGVASLVLGTTKVVKVCNEYRSKYKIASITLPAIATECHTISIALSQIERLFELDPNGVASRLDSKPHLRLVLDNALAGCAIVVSIIEDEVTSLMNSANDDVLAPPGRKARIKYVWNEDTMKELLQQARGQQLAIQTLLAVLQTESLYQVQQMIEAQGNVLTRIAQRAFSLRETRSQSGDQRVSDQNHSTGVFNITSGSSTEFSFDNEVINTKVYRNLFRKYDRAMKGGGSLARNEKVLVSSMYSLELNSHEETSSSTAPSGFSTFSDPETASVSQRRRLSFDNPPDAAASSTDKDSDAITLTDTRPNQDETIARLRDRAQIGKKIVASDGIPQTPRVTDEMTLLHAMATSDQVAFAKRALEADQDPNILFKGQVSPLLLAAEAENLPMVKLLLEHGANVELVGSEKRYPLCEACKQGNLQIVEILLEKGADPNVTTSTGLTPLVSSVFCDSLSMVEALLNSGAKTDTMCNGMTALHFAASQGHSKILRSLIQHSASVQPVSEKFGTPLHVAASYGKLEAMRTLLRAGAEVDFFSGPEHETALHASVRNSEKDATDLLLGYGADIDARDSKDIPPWLRAIKAENADILELLLRHADRGFDLEHSYTAVKITGLQTAAIQNHPACVAVLLRKGANPTNRGLLGHLPASITEDEDVRRLLKRATETWEKKIAEIPAARLVGGAT